MQCRSLTTTATLFLLAFFLLFGSRSALAQGVENKPDYYQVQTDSPLNDKAYQLAAGQQFQACIKAGQEIKGADFIRCDVSPTQTCNPCTFNIPKATGGNYTYTYTSYQYSIMYWYYPAAPNPRFEVGLPIRVTPQCRPAYPWTPATSCTCTSQAFQSQNRGYFDQGFIADQLKIPPVQYCSGGVAVTTEAGNVSVSLGLGLEGCVVKPSVFGPYRGSDAGIRHTYLGMDYVSQIERCSPSVEGPPLKGYIPVDACPAGFVFGVAGGIEKCIRTVNANTLPSQVAGPCTVGMSCWFDPGSAPVVPTTPPDSGSGAGTGSGSGTGTGSGTSSSIFSGVCALPLIDKICDWFKQDTTDPLYTEGQTATSSTTTQGVNEYVSPVNLESTFGWTPPACPASKQVSYFGQSIELPFTYMCAVAQGIMPGVMICAAMAALLIVFGFKRD